ncbi:UvrD-helicase domain-containing protein [Buchnera aphidicola (Astegopteryx bambusae)]
MKQMIEIKNIKKYFLKNKKLNFLYKYIKKFFKKKFFMKEFIIYKILQKIPNIVKIEKKNKSIINFDDLVKIVKKKIKKNKNILLYLKKKYPVAIIDEFQDTDYDQQEILMKIYGKNNKKNIMIIFADPKQCIYDFRGSNILLYNKFKKKIKDKYFLDTNWRTSSQIIKFINNIFLKVKNPFVNKNIIFKKSKYTKKNNKIKIIVDKVEKKNFKIIFYKKSQINLEKYFAWSSKKCAKQIKKLLYLGKKKRAKIKYHNKTKFISKKDIAILVANKFEYYYIKKTLNKYKIKSYYQFKKINIYNEEETKEILILLKSIIDYSNKQKIINAISTKIISEDIKKIYDIQKNKTKLFKKIKEFKKYKKILKKTGILNLIKYIIIKNIVKKNIFNKEKIEKYIKKYFYISKFLEKKMYKFKKINLLIHWLEIKINQKNVNKYKYFNKNEKMNGIKVISIHRSKGLEYPITIIPFIMHVSKKNDFTYYDIKTYTKIIDLKKNNKSKKKFLKEKILNNIKLLYVSLTRAIVHCTIIIGVTKNRKGSKHTDVHKSGIGYILQKKKKKNFLEFKKIIKNLKKKF